MSGAVSALIRRVTPRSGKSALPPESATVLAAIPKIPRIAMPNT